MPMHDWKRVAPTLYHHFQQRWTVSICDALNAGILPPGYSALVDRYSSGVYPDVLAVQRRRPSPRGSGTRTLAAPQTRMTVRPRDGRFHERANRVVVRHLMGEVVCAIEVVSPGNKAGTIAVREFVEKAVDFLKRGVNLLVIDPFPPGTQDPHTLHQLIGMSSTRACRSAFPPRNRFCSQAIAPPCRWWSSPRKRSSNRWPSGRSCPRCRSGWTPRST